MSKSSFTRKESDLPEPSDEAKLPSPLDVSTIKYTSGSIIQRTDTMNRWVDHLPSNDGVFSSLCMSVCVVSTLITFCVKPLLCPFLTLL